MSSIKKLKSGSVPSMADTNPVIPQTKINLMFGQVDTQNLIQRQANSTTYVEVDAQHRGGVVKP